MIRLAAFVAALTLGGCQALPALGAAGAGGALAWMATAREADQINDIALENAKPLVRQWCQIEARRPHGAKGRAALDAFCSNLPDNAGGVLAQLVAVLAAVRRDDQPELACQPER